MVYNWGVKWDDWYNDMMHLFPPTKKGYEIINYGMATEPLHKCASSVPAGQPFQSMPFNHTTGANLYEALVSKSLQSLTNATVLEISSGRGGGTALLSDCYCPSQMVGVDFSTKQVLSAQSRYGRNGSCPIQFVQGDAMALPFGNESFDVVVNVEASHAYPDYRNFIQEAHRVLRPGGTFLTTDFRFLNDAVKDGLVMESIFNQTVHPENITAQVLRSFHENKLIMPWLIACEADMLNAQGDSVGNFTELLPVKRSSNWKPHKRGAGIGNSMSCPLHAGAVIEPSLRQGNAIYNMYALKK